MTCSVVLLARHTPADLQRVLAALSQQLCDNFEVIVVAGVSAAAALRASGQADTVKLVDYEGVNLSTARNLGIQKATGEIIAFLDDATVPEPTWLAQLIAPLERAPVAAVGGFVRAADGLSFARKAQTIDGRAVLFDLEVDEELATLLTPANGQAFFTPAANMAVRRHLLLELGGFDPALGGRLSVADFNMRLAQTGHSTAVAPLAQVHARSMPPRSAQDWFETGAGLGVYLRKYCPPTEHAAAYKRLMAHHRSEIDRRIVSGGAEPRDLRFGLKHMKKGLAEGKTRRILPLHPLATSADAILPYETRPTAPSRVLWGWVWQARSLRQEARSRAREGEIITLYLFSPGFGAHRMGYVQGGYWEQRGGLLGRSEASDPGFQVSTQMARVRLEVSRISATRHLQNLDHAGHSAARA